MNKRLTVKMGPGRATPARGALHRPPTVLGLRTPLNTLIADTRIDGIMPGGVRRRSIIREAQIRRP